jgi:hypothetical protein
VVPTQPLLPIEFKEVIHKIMLTKPKILLQAIILKLMLIKASFRLKTKRIKRSSQTDQSML